MSPSARSLANRLSPNGYFVGLAYADLQTILHRLNSRPADDAKRRRLNEQAGHTPEVFCRLIRRDQESDRVGHRGECG